MKQVLCRTICFAAMASQLAVSFAQGTLSVPIGRGMPSGRSAKMAARLKYAPPNNYLKHYLGDDRYRIAGGVWKVVSTQLDTYYHRPTCPNILRQHADIVIGFSHSRDAEEAGYRADSVCQPQQITVLYGQAQNALTGYLTSPTRLTLADGGSTVVVPAGWGRMGSTSSEHQNIRFYVDMFMRKGGRPQDMVIIITAPATGMNVEAELKTALNKKPGASAAVTGSAAGRWDQFRAGMAATNPTGKGSGNWLVQPKKGTLAGRTAYFGKIGDTSVAYGGKGTKFFMVIGPNTGGAAALRNSFRIP